MSSKSKRKFGATRISRNRGLGFESLENRQLMAVDLAIDTTSHAVDRLLVQVRPGAVLSSYVNNIETVSGLESLGENGWHQVSLQNGSNIASVMQQLQGLSDVITVAPDFRVSLTTTPNDPMFASQWPLSGSGGRIDASQAWNYGTSSNIVVAVIDTGIDYKHPDLASNIWTNSREIAGNGIDDDSNGYRDDVRGWNFVGNNNNPMDDNGHGTHVAGTIGAVGNNGVGVAGVAWNVKLMPLKFLDSKGSGYLSDAVRAVDYARANGAKIINASFGGGGFSAAMQSAIQRFQQAGGVFVAAAGNESANNANTASYPANYTLPNVVSVAASTQSNTLASFSNYGSNVDIAAPGHNILSTLPGGRYGSLSGTSMAAPHVAGALALLWGQSPALSASELINLVTSNTDSFVAGKTIHGKLNVGKAAAALRAANPITDDGPKDIIAPYVQSAQWDTSLGAIDNVLLDFSEEMNVDSVSKAITVTGPNGAVTIASVQKSSADASKVVVRFASPQSGAGAYRIDLASTARDLAGNLLNQDRDSQAGETQQDRFNSQATLPASEPSPVVLKKYSSAQGVSLRDASLFRTGVTRVAIDVADNVAIEDLSVELSITHSYASDLRVRLISPTGTVVTLVNRRGGSSKDLNLNFSDSATRSVSGVRSNLNGAFRSEQALSAFMGQNARGRWTVEISDHAIADAGVLNSAKLMITPKSSASTHLAAPAVDSASPTSFRSVVGQMIDALLRRRW
jgi:serine protease